MTRHSLSPLFILNVHKKVPLSIASVTFRVQAIVENLGNLLGDQKLLGHFFQVFAKLLFGALQLHFSQLSYGKYNFCNYGDRRAQNRKTKYWKIKMLKKQLLK